MDRVAYIQEKDGKYCVRSEKNPKWSGGCYDTKAEAEKALARVEMFKHMKNKKKKSRKSSEPLEIFNEYVMLEAATRAAAIYPKMASIMRKATIPGMEWLKDEEILQVTEDMVAALKAKSAGRLEKLIPKLLEMLKRSEFVLKSERQKKQLKTSPA